MTAGKSSQDDYRLESETILEEVKNESYFKALFANTHKNNLTVLLSEITISMQGGLVLSQCFRS